MYYKYMLPFSHFDILCRFQHDEVFNVIYRQ